MSENDGGRRGLQSRDFCPYTLMSSSSILDVVVAGSPGRNQCINLFIPYKRNKYHLRNICILFLFIFRRRKPHSSVCTLHFTAVNLDKFVPCFSRTEIEKFELFSMIG